PGGRGRGGVRAGCVSDGRRAARVGAGASGRLQGARPRDLRRRPAVDVDAQDRQARVGTKGDDDVSGNLEGRTLWELIERRVAATPDARFGLDEDGRSLGFAGYEAA